MSIDDKRDLEASSAEPKPQRERIENGESRMAKNRSRRDSVLSYRFSDQGREAYPEQSRREHEVRKLKCNNLEILRGLRALRGKKIFRQREPLKLRLVTNP